MKLSLVVLAVLFAVAAASPLSREDRNLVKNLLDILKREEQQPQQVEGENKETEKEAEEEEQEEEKEAPKEEVAHEEKLRMYMAKLGCRQQKPYSLVTKKDYEGVSKDFLDAMKAIKKRVTSGGENLDKIEDEIEKVKEEISENDKEEDDEKRNAALDTLNSIGKDKELVKQILCATMGMGIIMRRHLILGDDEKDYKDANNCHSTCVLSWKIKMGLEKVTPALVKAASEEDMKCLFESRLKTSIAAAEKAVKEAGEESAHKAAGGIARNFLDFTKLYITGAKIHFCISQLKKQTEQKAVEPKAGAKRALEKLLSSDISW